MKDFLVAMMVLLTPALAQSKIEPKVELGSIFLKSDGQPRSVAVVVEEGAVIHDFIASYSILDFISKGDLEFHFVAVDKGLKTDGLGKAKFMANTSLDEIPNPDILIIGGIVNMELMQNKKFMSWLKRAYEGSEYTISICSGGVLLAATGALNGKKAAVGIFSRKFFEKFGGVNVSKSVYVDGKLLSASGISGGTEVAFELIEQISSSKDLPKAVSLMLEFTPSHKYDVGDWSNAPKTIKDLVLNINQQLGFPNP